MSGRERFPWDEWLGPVLLLPRYWCHFFSSETMRILEQNITGFYFDHQETQHQIQHLNPILWWVPGGSDSKESACNAGDPGLVPGSRRSLEKGVATHSFILAWRIPWTEEPGRLQSMGLQRVRHDWATNSTTTFKVDIQFQAQKLVTWGSRLTPKYGYWVRLPRWG